MSDRRAAFDDEPLPWLDSVPDEDGRAEFRREGCWRRWSSCFRRRARLGYLLLSAPRDGPTSGPPQLIKGRRARTRSSRDAGGLDIAGKVRPHSRPARARTRTPSSTSTATGNGRREAAENSAFPAPAPTVAPTTLGHRTRISRSAEARSRPAPATAVRQRRPARRLRRSAQAEARGQRIRHAFRTSAHSARWSSPSRGGSGCAPARRARRRQGRCARRSSAAGENCFVDRLMLAAILASKGWC